jgi:hypothetical protein
MEFPKAFRRLNSCFGAAAHLSKVKPTLTEEGEPQALNASPRQRHLYGVIG